MALTGRALIASRCAKFFKDGDLVNLGIGLPVQCVNYLPEGVEVWLEAEIGIVGSGKAPSWDKADPDMIDAGGQPTSAIPGGSVVEHSVSFGLIRGGHVDAAVLGTLQVDQEGNIANWIVPGKKVAGMGGAMVLCVGCPNVIITMMHTQKGAPKIKKHCTLPLTAEKCVTKIITEMCVIEVREDGLWVTELHPDFTKEEVQAATEAELHWDPDCKPYQED
jgi:acetate CoA/acetoacetate CoA-transferase beta subunit